MVNSGKGNLPPWSVRRLVRFLKLYTHMEFFDLWPESWIWLIVLNRTQNIDSRRNALIRIFFIFACLTGYLRSTFKGIAWWRGQGIRIRYLSWQGTQPHFIFASKLTAVVLFSLTPRVQEALQSWSSFQRSWVYNTAHKETDSIRHKLSYIPRYTALTSELWPHL